MPKLRRCRMPPIVEGSPSDATDCYSQRISASETFVVTGLMSNFGTVSKRRVPAFVTRNQLHGPENGLLGNVSLLVAKCLLIDMPGIQLSYSERLAVHRT